MGLVCTPGNKIQPIDDDENQVKLGLKVSYDSDNDKFELTEEESEILTDMIEDKVLEIYQDIVDVFPDIRNVSLMIEKIS